MKIEPIGTIELIDGTKVPKYENSLPVPINSCFPHSFAIVDLKNGEINTLDPGKFPNHYSLRLATDKEVRLIEKVVRLHKGIMNG